MAKSPYTRFLAFLGVVPRGWILLALLAVSAALWMLIFGLVGAVLAADPLRSLLPPARYDHEPTRPYHVREVSQARIDALCRGEVEAAGRSGLGCTLPGIGAIYLLDGMPRETRAVVLRHEKAHINGWRH